MGRLSKSAAALSAAVLLVAGGAAYALASSTASKITVCVKHNGGTLYKAKKCARHDNKLSWNKQGPRGATGAKGLKGDTGAQGPGGSILTYNATASASPPTTTVGSVLGDTWTAQCSIPAVGEAKVILFLVTSDGSFKADAGTEIETNGTATTEALSNNFPAGTITSPTIAGQATAPATAPNVSDTHVDITQIAPSPGHLVLHVHVTSAPAQACHISIEGFPETITASSTAARAATALSSRPLLGP